MIIIDLRCNDMDLIKFINYNKLSNYMFSMLKIICNDMIFMNLINYHFAQHGSEFKLIKITLSSFFFFENITLFNI